MWILLAFVSATLLGLYDTSKKFSLRGNEVIPVLFLNTLFCSAIFLPLILLSQYTHVLDSCIFHVGAGGWEMHRWIILKSIIVLLSWVFGYFAIAQLPLTIVGPINATRPVMTLIGAMLVFGERLNIWQWVGVSLAIISLFLLARSGKREGIDFKHNKWIFFLVLAAMMGTCSGLLDKYLMASPENGGVGLDRMMAQSWYNIYQMYHDGCSSPCLYLQSEKESRAYSPFLMEVVYPAHIYIPINGRLCLLLCTLITRRDDFHCVNGTPWFRPRIVLMRCIIV